MRKKAGQVEIELNSVDSEGPIAPVMGLPTGDSMLSIADLQGRALKKHAAAVHVSGTLTAVQRRLANIMLLRAYDDLLIPHKTHQIPVAWLFELLDWRGSRDWASLRAAVIAIRETGVEFDLMTDSPPTTGGKKWATMGLISYGEIEGGMLKYRYEPELARELYHPYVYATIYIDVQNRFKSQFALNLYENCLRYQRLEKAEEPGSTGFKSVERWRKLLGATSETYDEFKRFNAKVLKPAAAHVNNLSDIHVTPDFRKDAKGAVTDIRFLVKQNPTFAKPGVGIIADQYAPVIERLAKHQINPALARSLITGALSADQISDLIDYAESTSSIKDKSGWLVRLVKAGAALSDAQAKKLKDGRNRAKEAGDEIAKTQKTAAMDVAEKQQKAAARKWIAGLSMEELGEYVAQFIKTDGASAYESDFDAEVGRFNRSEAQLAFTIFLTSHFKKTQKSNISGST